MLVLPILPQKKQDTPKKEFDDSNSSNILKTRVVQHNWWYEEGDVWIIKEILQSYGGEQPQQHTYTQPPQERRRREEEERKELQNR